MICAAATESMAHPEVRWSKLHYCKSLIFLPDKVDRFEKPWKSLDMMQAKAITSQMGHGPSSASSLRMCICLCLRSSVCTGRVHAWVNARAREPPSQAYTNGSA